MQTEIIFYFLFRSRLKNLEAHKIVIFRSTSLKLSLLIRKLYVDLKSGLNLGNSITNESVDPLQNCANGDYLFLPNYLLQLETLGAHKIVILKSTSLKLSLLNWKSLSFSLIFTSILSSLLLIISILLFPPFLLLSPLLSSFQ